MWLTFVIWEYQRLHLCPMKSVGGGGRQPKGKKLLRLHSPLHLGGCLSTQSSYKELVIIKICFFLIHEDIFARWSKLHGKWPLHDWNTWARNSEESPGLRSGVSRRIMTVHFLWVKQTLFPETPNSFSDWIFFLQYSSFQDHLWPDNPQLPSVTSW